MRIAKTALLAGLCATGLSFSAAAADWSGFYAGGQLGYVHSTTDYGDLDDYYDNQEMNGLTDDGVTVGAVGGYNWQSGSLVYGVELALAYLSNSNVSNTGCVDCGETLTTDINYTGTLLGRVGVAVDKAVIFVGVGPAWADLDFENNDSGSVGTDSGTEVGFAIAGGIETMFTDHLSGRLQAEFMNFGDSTYQDTVNVTPFRDTTSTVSVNLGVAWNF
jgi:outer membrane immunogenic protein